MTDGRIARRGADWGQTGARPLAQHLAQDFEHTACPLTDTGSGGVFADSSREKAIGHGKLDFKSEGPNRVTRDQNPKSGDGMFAGRVMRRRCLDPSRQVFDPECRL